MKKSRVWLPIIAGSYNRGWFIPDLTCTVTLAQDTFLSSRGWGCQGSCQGEASVEWKWKPALPAGSCVQQGLQPGGFHQLLPSWTGWLRGYNITAAWVFFYFSNEQNFWDLKIKVGTSNFFKCHFFFFFKNTISPFFIVKYFFPITQTSVNKRISKLDGLTVINIILLPQTKCGVFSFTWSLTFFPRKMA